MSRRVTQYRLMRFAVAVLRGDVVLVQMSPSLDQYWILFNSVGGSREPARSLTRDPVGQWAGGSAPSSSARVEVGVWPGAPASQPTPSHDPRAHANTMLVEQEKPADQQGKYLNPEAHGQPRASGIGRELQPPAQPAARARP